MIFWSLLSLGASVIDLSVVHRLHIHWLHLIQWQTLCNTLCKQPTKAFTEGEETGIKLSNCLKLFFLDRAIIKYQWKLAFFDFCCVDTDSRDKKQGTESERGFHAGKGPGWSETHPLTVITWNVIFVSLYLTRSVPAHLWFAHSCGNSHINWDCHIFYLEDEEIWQSWRSRHLWKDGISRELCCDGWNVRSSALIVLCGNSLIFLSFSNSFLSNSWCIHFYEKQMWVFTAFVSQCQLY